MRISDWSSDVCSSDLDEGKLELASAYVRMHYPTEAHSADRRKLSNDILQAWNDPTRSAEAGKKFENFAFGSLYLGGKFPCFPMLANGARASEGSLREFDQLERLEIITSEIGRAHVRTPVTKADLVCRLLLEKK